MSKIDEYLKNQGFIFPNNDIYGGRKGFFDYGHLGVLVKRNIQKVWEEYFVMKNPDVYFMDPCIMGTEEVYKASGHIEHFNDVLVDCKKCRKRFKEDSLPEDKVCPSCGENVWTNPKTFQLIYKSSPDEGYLRPETAQGIYINVRNFIKLYSPKLPFGIGCVGKAFRNEVTISNTIYRTKEFEQMELEWFSSPRESNILFKKSLDEIADFLEKEMGFKKEEHFVLKEIGKSEMAHYSKYQTDIMFNFPWGWEELWGIAHRGEYDLEAHQRHSKKSMEYLDPDNAHMKFIPNVVEHSVGLNRLMYAVISVYLEEHEDRTILKLPFHLAPYEFCILPLTKEEIPLATSIYKEFLAAGKRCWFSRRGTIGKRYKKNDEIGTFYCVTVDKGSRLDMQNPTFTVRHRDTTEQKEYDLATLRENGFNVEV